MSRMRCARFGNATPQDIARRRETDLRHRHDESRLLSVNNERRQETPALPQSV
jgi:hypothetical protein